MFFFFLLLFHLRISWRADSIRFPTYKRIVNHWSRRFQALNLTNSKRNILKIYRIRTRRHFKPCHFKRRCFSFCVFFFRCYFYVKILLRYVCALCHFSISINVPWTSYGIYFFKKKKCLIFHSTVNGIRVSSSCPSTVKNTFEFNEFVKIPILGAGRWPVLRTIRGLCGKRFLFYVNSCAVVSTF